MRSITLVAPDSTGPGNSHRGLLSELSIALATKFYSFLQFMKSMKTCCVSILLVQQTSKERRDW